MKWAFTIDSVPFTRGILNGVVSLGGSESACIGLARALARRGHEVAIFATQLEPDAAGPDGQGVSWFHLGGASDQFGPVSRMTQWDVLVALRFAAPLASSDARYRILWNQDTLHDQWKASVMASAFAFDAVAYVSAFQRKQWEAQLPELAPLGWVTRNGYDPSIVPIDGSPVPHRIIHISRPERGLSPLLQMWPALRARVPDATLRLCRYSSMYDAGGWGKICAEYDAWVADVQRTVGGIEYLGELGKVDLYRELAAASVMWYPGVPDFAETSCIAAIEAQACGTPLVLSYKGALPETAPEAVFIDGDANTPAYQVDSVDAVAEMLADRARDGRRTRERIAAGRAHVRAYTYDAIAAEWDAFVSQAFATRAVSCQAGIAAQLEHEDDFAALRHLADAMGEAAVSADAAFVMRGEDQTAEDYGARAMPDPVLEGQQSSRLQYAASLLADCTHVLDVACGNGAFALLLTGLSPTVRVTGIDYSAANVDKAREAAAAAGVSDRALFVCAPVWDLQTQRPTPWPVAAPDVYDGAFIGEFLEHVADVSGFVDYLETRLARGAKVLATTPHGPYVELLHRSLPRLRGHVHHYRREDLEQIFGLKQDFSAEYLTVGMTSRGHEVGTWIVGYRTGGGPARARDLAARVQRTRPMAQLSVGIMTSNSALDLAKCLDSVWGIADEIVIGDASSTDQTRAIAAEYGARVIDVPTVMEHPDGFAGVRNLILDATTHEWFLWIDSDEVLIDGFALPKYLDSQVYRGIALHQNHLYLDMPSTHDTPIRLFRKGPDIRFYGCIHEQPQMGDCNGDLVPSLEVLDVQIAHFGYLTERVRRGKAQQRNLPLLTRDQTRFPDRRLGKLLVIRDLVHLGNDAQAAGQTDQASQAYGKVVALYEKHFAAAPLEKLSELARPYYHTACQHVRGAWEIEMAFAGRQQGLNGSHAQPQRYWVRSWPQADALIAAKTRALAEAFTPPPPDTDPVAPRPSEVCA